MSGNDLRASQRGALLAAGAVALVLGAWGGLWRMDWEIPLPGTQIASFHGALMIAFFGALVGLEHAAARGGRLACLSPACAALGGLATAFAAPHLFAASLLLAGSVLLAVLAFGNWRQDAAPHGAMGLAGALCGVAGNALWLAELPASEATGAWLAFLVLTVVAERLELSQPMRPGKVAMALLAAAALLLAAGALLLPWNRNAGAVAAGVALVCLALWLLGLDAARADLRGERQARFASLCLIGGYLWLAAGGLVLPFAGDSGPLYDGALHAVFIGFAFAAAIAHASAILPGLLEIDMPFTPLSYVLLALLNATLLLRLAGDLLGWPALAAWGGMGNAAALALFLALTAAGVRRGRRREAGS